ILPGIGIIEKTGKIWTLRPSALLVQSSTAGPASPDGLAEMKEYAAFYLQEAELQLESIDPLGSIREDKDYILRLDQLLAQLGELLGSWQSQRSDTVTPHRSPKAPATAKVGAEVHRPAPALLSGGAAAKILPSKTRDTAKRSTILPAKTKAAT